MANAASLHHAANLARIRCIHAKLPTWYMGPVLIANVDVHLQTAMYGHLAALQGQAIPRLVAAGDVGYDASPTVKFIATEYAGRSVQLEAEDIDRALCSLRQVHDMGVLHGDIHQGNVLVNEEASAMSAASAICYEFMKSSLPTEQPGHTSRIIFVIVSVLSIQMAGHVALHGSSLQASTCQAALRTPDCL